MQKTTTVPLVNYLVLADEPHLVAQECTACGARYFDRRNACAACGASAFRAAAVATTGTLRGFTIVAQAAPGIEVPFVAGIIDCEGTTVRANVVHVQPDPAHVRAGMKLRLVTFPIGTDSHGTQAISFGFEPLEGAADVQQ
jgi:uncharacterized OB-fold protein